MDVKIIPHKLSGEIEIVSSKSHVHRVLIAAALSTKKTVLEYKGISEDIKETINCLRKLGSQIKVNSKTIEITPIKNYNLDEVRFDIKESGTTARLIVPVAAAICKKVIVNSGERLSKRPMKPLIDVLGSCGVKTDNDNFPLVLTGKLQSGIFEISGAISSQFITGLLLALPLLDGDSEIIITDKLSSEGYIDLTMDVLSEFGIAVSVKGNRFIIPGNQKYKTIGNIKAEGDWSNAAFWLSAGAFSEKITCIGLESDSCQPDSDIMRLLCLFGANVKYKNEKFSVSKQQLDAVNIDVDGMPDLVPIISVLAAVSKGQSLIINAERLKLKESNRLEAISQNLMKLGADIVETSDGLKIIGVDTLQGGELESFNDHRIVMAMAIAASICNSEVIIKNADAVNKSYPTFFEDYKKLGGVVDVL